MPPSLETLYRLALAAIVLGVPAIGAPRRLRAERVGGRVSPRADPKWFWAGMAVCGPPLVLAILGFLVAPRWVEFAQVSAPAALRLLGIPLGAAGLALFAWMFRHLGDNVTSTSVPRAAAVLVTTGPYHWIRHPMYSASLVLVAAATLLTANTAVALGGLAMFALLAARSRIEEARLVDKFGDAYRDYQRRTGRFVPRFRR